MLMDQPEDGQTKQVLEQKLIASGRHLTNTNVVFIPRKPRCICHLAVLNFITLFDALGDRSCMLNC
jgi:hypothetical protein